MARSKLSRMARIRAYCTTETYQQALLALKAASTEVPERGPDLMASRRAAKGGEPLVRECLWCGEDGLVHTLDLELPAQLGPDAVWFCYICQETCPADAIVPCSYCGELTTETEMEVCGDCFSWQIG